MAISPRTVRRLAASKVIGHHRIGGQIRFTDDDINEFLSRTRVDAVS